MISGSANWRILARVRAVIWYLRNPQPVRRRLPERRHSDTFDFEFEGLRAPITVTVGYYPDGAVGDVFIDAGKAGEQIAAIARDSAIILSHALQYGAPLEVVARALTRDDRHAAQTIVCVAVDKLLRAQGVVIAPLPGFGEDGSIAC
ncbi:hypothetical protein LPW26_05980 [Rhodopseudomonas sp. HC1]|uniref:TSCPD domain-containing protein n=1 Tax=Rhodopseudomonas infernalis TaxID=2897386 RepID=UPI001EE81879|nr:hypothetical protein [Rhodopseudomonas infernalis]MCG6204175.1 hypothetical protein [Rhodopseudomonas infernalis]